MLLRANATNLTSPDLSKPTKRKMKKIKVPSYKPPKLMPFGVGTKTVKPQFKV
jgi:hypothetical protein